MSSRLPVVVLAGGEGRRIGGGKPFRRLGGETLIDRAVRIASGWSDDVRVAVRPGIDPAAPVPLLEDDPAVAGPLGGVASAVRHAVEQGRERVLVIPCDTPFLPRDLPERLAGAIGDCGAAIAGSGGRLHPACSLWSCLALGSLSAYLATGRRSLLGFAEQVGFVTVDWAAEPADPFFNINDEDQLREAEGLLRR